jgi:hypothetical protein
MPYALTILGRRFLADKWVTGYWAWELARLPDAWMKGFACVDEVAVPSGFVVEAVEAVGTGSQLSLLRILQVATRPRYRRSRSAPGVPMAPLPLSPSPIWSPAWLERTLWR